MPSDGQTVGAVVDSYMSQQYEHEIAGAWFKASLECILSKPNYHIKLCR